jgi:hypothetical protein
VGDVRFIVMAVLFASFGVFVFLRPDLAKSANYDHPLNHSPLWPIRSLGIGMMVVAWVFVREYIRSR